MIMFHHFSIYAISATGQQKKCLLPGHDKQISMQQGRAIQTNSCATRRHSSDRPRRMAGKSLGQDTWRSNGSIWCIRIYCAIHVTANVFKQWTSTITIIMYGSTEHWHIHALFNWGCPHAALTWDSSLPKPSVSCSTLLPQTTNSSCWPRHSMAIRVKQRDIKGYPKKSLKGPIGKGKHEQNLCSPRLE